MNTVHRSSHPLRGALAAGLVAASLMLPALVSAESAPSGPGKLAPGKTGSAAALPASSSHRAAALALLDAAGVSQAIVAGVTALVDAQVNKDPLMVSYKDVVDAWKARRLTWANMSDDLSTLYMEAFTEQELRELTAFYNTQLGRKAVAKIPELTRSGAQMASSVAFKYLPELQTQLEERKAAVAAKVQGKQGP